MISTDLEVILPTRNTLTTSAPSMVTINHSTKSQEHLCPHPAPTIYQEVPKHDVCQHTVNEMIRATHDEVFILGAIWSSPPNLRLLPRTISSSWHLLNTDFDLAISIATCCLFGQHVGRSHVLLCRLSAATSARLLQNKTWCGFQDKSLMGGKQKKVKRFWADAFFCVCF